MAVVHSSVQNTISFTNSQGDKARGTLIKLSRTLLVMEVYNPYSIVQLSEVLEDLEIYRGSLRLYKGRGVVSNLVNTGLMLIVSATLVDKWENMASLEGEQTLAEEAAQFVDGWSQTQSLYAGYQLIVGKIRSFLYELNMWMDQMGLIDDDSNPAQSRVPNETLELLVREILPKLKEMFVQFEAESRNVQDDQLMTHKLYAQHDLHPLLMRSPFVHRTFTKPLGYAGDYEMVNMMARSGWEGPTSYAKIINYFHILEGPAQAHRNRIDILVKYLEELGSAGAKQGRKINILNIACGPALEVQRFIRESENSEYCQFTLLDFSDVTLNYTRNKINQACAESARSLDVNYVHESVHKLLKKVHAQEIDLGEAQYDFVYCAGLFDYLSDRVCARLLRLFYRLIDESGRVLVSNVDPSNSSTALMEHLLEWYLIYRDQAHLGRLVPGVGSQHTFSDDTGMNVFLEISRDNSKS